MIDLPEPPDHLGEHGAKLWRSVLEDWDISTGDALAILAVACSACDEMHEAAAIIKEHGIALATRTGGLKTNPACAVERSARAAMLRALSQLNLRDDEKPKIGRPVTRI